MKVHVSENLPGVFEIRNMPAGSLGVCLDTGRLYFRTMTQAACLSNYGSSYSDPNVVTTKVRMLPKGTKVTLEVE